MKIILIAVLLAAMQSSAPGAEVAVIKSGLPPYDSALQGFEAVLAGDVPAGGPKSVQAHSLTIYNLSAQENPQQIRQKITADPPDLLLAIGSSSLALVKDITAVPIIYLLVPFPEQVISVQDNITGINLQISAARQLEALQKNLPQIKSVGLLYDPRRSGAFVQEAQEFARLNNLTLAARPVRQSRDVPGELAWMAGKVDMFWMLPDPTVLTPRTIDHIFLFSLENRIPILTFSKKYLDMGALLSIAVNPFDMGKQAGDMALKILRRSKSPVPPEPVRTLIVQKNEAAAQMLGFDFSETDSKD